MPIVAFTADARRLATANRTACPEYRFGELSGEFSRKIYSNVNEHVTNDHRCIPFEW